MNAILRHNYEEAREQYLENLAYMNRQNDEFAEQNGGADNLPDDKRRIYEGRRLRIIRLVAYHDRAQEYIEDLYDWIDDLITENRRLAAEKAVAAEGWKRFFPRLLRGDTESQREHDRRMSITKLQLEHPELF